jgi:hypothetical protein
MYKKEIGRKQQTSIWITIPERGAELDQKQGLLRIVGHPIIHHLLGLFYAFSITFSIIIPPTAT